MNDILKKIMDIENQAKEIMLEVELMERGAADAIRNDVDKLKADASRKTEIRLEKARADEKRRFDEEIKNQQAVYKTQSENLAAAFDKNSSSWEQEVYNRIIGSSSKIEGF